MDKNNIIKRCQNDYINLILNITGHTQNKYEFLTFYVHLQNNISKSYNL